MTCKSKPGKEFKENVLLGETKPFFKTVHLCVPYKCAIVYLRVVKKNKTHLAVEFLGGSRVLIKFPCKNYFVIIIIINFFFFACFSIAS